MPSNTNGINIFPAAAVVVSSASAKTEGTLADLTVNTATSLSPSPAMDGIATCTTKSALLLAPRVARRPAGLHPRRP